MSHIYHIRVQPDQHGNEATTAQLSRIKRKFVEATKLAQEGKPAVVVTLDRVSVQVVPVSYEES